MRASLRWTLGGVLLVSAAALLWPTRRWDVVAPLTRGELPAQRSSSPADAAILPLPSVLEAWVIEPARRDPFALQPTPAPAPIAAAPALPAPITLPATVLPPAPPPLLWRVIGIMKTPEGVTLVVLDRNEGPSVVASPGLQLGDGFEVTAIEATGVRLRHPAYPEDMVVPIPPPPELGR